MNFKIGDTVSVRKKIGIIIAFGRDNDALIEMEGFNGHDGMVPTWYNEKMEVIEPYSNGIRNRYWYQLTSLKLFKSRFKPKFFL